MPRRPAAHLLTACAVVAAWLTPLAARADAPQVSAALLFLQASCGLKDAKMEARRSEGRLLLTLRTPQFTRQTNLVHNDLRLFTEESMKRNAEMPPELGACFYPASNQVINVLMELPAQVASLPMAPPPAAAQAPHGGGYVPPMVLTPAPAVAAAPPPTVVQATAAPAAPSIAAAATDAPTFSVQGCRTASRNVVCEVRIANNTGKDQWIVIHGRQTMLFDPSGGANELDDARMANQGGLNWSSGIGKVRVIHDTAPIMQLTFRNVAESIQSVKRLEVSIGFDSPDGQRLSKLSLADLPIQGR